MEFQSPATIDEAVAILAARGADAYPLAGGTDLMLQYLNGEVRPGVMLHLGRVPGLDGIESNGSTRIGSAATHSSLGADPSVRRDHPALAEAAGLVGGWQTQAVGTVGGNICNASPAADTVPPLLVADASAVLTGPTGTREVSLDGFFADRRVTVRKPDELLVAVEAEPLPSGSGEVYLKVGRRGAMEVALVGLAARLGFADSGEVASARIALCSVAPVPMRMPAAEAALVGSTLEPEALDAAAEAVREAAAPIDDPRASAGYRLRVLRGLLGRAADVCRDRAQ